jgi:A/G-specific adenine glycosylase
LAGAVLSSPAVRRDLRRAVLAWFAHHGRELDFRVDGQPDPWGTLVSEVMAQQTQIGRVEERWPGFMAVFPTADAMAAASPADVIRAWRGMGYDRRALNLHRAAVMISAAGGRVPGDVDGLLGLPGIGPYTARAVAAIAFGIPVGAVDVNVRRVLLRILGEERATIAPASLQAAADALVDPDRPGTWTHALMDIGATVCRPARPSCASCPAQPWCRTAGATRTRAQAASIRATASRATASRATDRVSPGPRPAHVPFEQTTRWLRGRLLDRLRDTAPGEALAVAGPLGAHSEEAVARALAGLARDGMVELDAAGRARLLGDRVKRPASEPAAMPRRQPRQREHA